MQNTTIRLMGQEEVAKMRVAGKAAAELLCLLGQMAKPGVSTADLDEFARRWAAEKGYTHGPLGYKGYKHAICTSINNVVCHGIPSSTDILKSGDIVNIDVTPAVDGFYGDTSRTFAIGEISPEAAALIQITDECLAAGIAVVKPGAHIGDIGAAIYKLARSRGFEVVREYSGHFIGKSMHILPPVPHFGVPGTGIRLEPGMIFTIEPMINVGTWQTRLEPDGWTVRTRDGLLSAQAEHTVLVTDEGAEVLTAAN